MKVYILNTSGDGSREKEGCTEQQTGIEQLAGWLLAKSYIEEVTVYKNPDRFLETVEKERPELVFIEMNNNIPGLQIGKIIKMMDQNIRIVYIAEQRDYAVDAYEIGASGYLLSPLNKRIFNNILMALSKDIKPYTL